MSRKSIGRIYRRKESRFLWVEFWAVVDGRRQAVRLSSGETNDDAARRFLTRKIAEFELGNPALPRQERVTFEVLWNGLERYYRRVENRSIKALNVRKRHLLRFFGKDRKALEITTALVNSYIDRRQQQRAANGSINRELAALSKAFNVAIAEGLLNVDQRPVFQKVREAKPRQGFVEPGDFKRFHALLPDYVKAPAMLMYWWGWRVQEVLSLRWSEVFLESKEIRLDPSRDKSGEGRLLPYEEFEGVVWAIEQALKHRTPVCPYVFHRHGKRMKSFNKAWRRACVEAKLPGLLRHDLRRCAVRNMTRAGIPERVAMMITGHKTRTTFERYNITAGTDVTIAGGRLSEYIGEQKTAKIVSLGRRKRR